MARTYTTTVLSELYAQNTDKVFLMCLEIDTPNLAEPIRVVNNPEDIISNVITTDAVYIRFAFELTLPEDTDTNALSSAKLKVDMVDRRIIAGIRAAGSRPDITYFLITADDPHNAILGPVTLEMANVQYNQFEVEGDLGIPTIFNESFPKETFSPPIVPALF